MTCSRPWPALGLGILICDRRVTTGAAPTGLREGRAAGVRLPARELGSQGYAQPRGAGPPSWQSHSCFSRL